MASQNTHKFAAHKYALNILHGPSRQELKDAFFGDSEPHIDFVLQGLRGVVRMGITRADPKFRDRMEWDLYGRIIGLAPVEVKACYSVSTRQGCLYFFPPVIEVIRNNRRDAVVNTSVEGQLDQMIAHLREDSSSHFGRPAIFARRR